MIKNLKSREIRKRRVRVYGTKERPRLSPFRSNKHIYAQLIDDQRGITLASCSDLELKKLDKKLTKTEIAKEVGIALAKKAKAKKIKAIVFDRNGYRFHGRVKALADGARAGGLKF